MKLKSFLVVIFLIFAAGCEDIAIGKNGRYSGDSDKKGNYLVLDTREGTVSILQHGQLVQIPSEESIKNVRKFESREISGFPITISDFNIKFRNGKLLYRGNIKYSEDILSSQKSEQKADESAKILNDIVTKIRGLWKSSSSSYIEILLTDSDGFNVTSFRVKQNDLYRIVDRAGNAQFLEFEGDVDVTPKNYEAISDYSFSWKLAKWQDKEG